MKESTKGLLIAGGVAGIVLITILIIKRRNRIITPPMASKMSEEKLKEEISSTIKKQALCGKLAEHKDNASEKKMKRNVKRVTKCMKTHAESMLNLANEMKKRLCAKDPTHEDC